MSWSNFDSSAQNEGGFMDTTVNEGAGGDDKGNLKRGQNCIPVMIGHILKHGEELTVWGTPVKIITFVAIVNKVDATSTKVTFEFQDETGQYLLILFPKFMQQGRGETPLRNSARLLLLTVLLIVCRCSKRLEMAGKWT